MRTFETRFFGTVSVAPGDDDTYLTADVTLAGCTAQRSLYLGAGLGASRLAAVVALLDDLETLDTKARAVLHEELESDAEGTVAEYLTFHLEELPDVVTTILGGKPATPAALLGRVALCGASAHLRDAGFVLVLDYSPDKEQTDALLAVTFDASGTPTNIAHES